MYQHLLDRWFAGIKGHAFAIRFWNGMEKRYGEGDPAFTVVIKKQDVLYELVGNLSLGFGEAYMRGDIEIDGSLEELMRLFYQTDLKDTPRSFFARTGMAFMSFRQRNRLGQAEKNIHRHYDLGNDFYALWLDKERVYSCGYFKTPQDSMDLAQEQKLEHICKKLFLRSGETFLDIGCGWGSLVFYAAKRYGVKAHGITLSKEQCAYAINRAREEGLQDRVIFEFSDYRELARTGRTFDRVASIGMFEHVGKEHIPAYLDATNRLLKPCGIGLLHTIGKMHATLVDPWIQKYIFPGGYLPGIGEIADAMKYFPFRITDIENLRLHYALTLDGWLKAFETNLEKVRALYGDSFVRMWRLYLAGSSAGFRYGALDLWQIQFTKGLRNDLPWTREYLHRRS